MKSYSELLKDPKWQVKRLQIFERDEHKCRTCGKETNLEVHHTIYINGNKPWEYDSKFLITQCDVCHDQVEVNKEKIKWSLAYLQSERPWFLENVFVFIKQNVKDEDLRDELREKLKQITLTHHV